MIIDLSGPDGDVFALFALMATVKRLGQMLGIPTDKVINDMMSDDYEHSLDVMKNWATENNIRLTLT